MQLSINRLPHALGPRRSCAVIVALVLLGAQAPLQAQLTPAIPFEGFQGIWYQVGPAANGVANKYGGGLATYPQQIAPLAVYAEEVDKTFFVFSVDLDLGSGRNIGHAISYYDHATRQVARPQVWVDKGTSDAHDAPVLTIDEDGYLYMFSMTHGETRRAWINKSGAPYDISSFESLISPSNSADREVFGALPGDSAITVRFSYASAWYLPEADADEKFLLLHTRYQSGERDLFTTSSVDADTWTPRKGFSQIERGQYQTSWIKPDGKSVGTIFDVHPAGGLDHRTDLYYLQTSDQGQTWQTIDGLTLIDNRGTNNNPLTARPDQPEHGAAQVYDAQPGERVYFKDVNYDAQGNPVILFLTTPTHVPGPLPGGAERTLYTAYWTGSQWSLNDVTTTDHNYDHGSLFVDGDGAWRIIGSFIDGPQHFGTGGEIGIWTTEDYGRSWTLEGQLTSDSEYNHTYPRRAVNAHDDFQVFWADGDAFSPSDVSFYFANKAGQRFQLPYHMDSDFAPVTPASLSADYNGDGVVDAADYTIWRDTLGSTTQLRADGNYSGIVDQRDYQLWKSQFSGNHSPIGATSIPEPATWLLVTSALLIAAMHRHKRPAPV